jgi:hypothetical protein
MNHLLAVILTIVSFWIWLSLWRPAQRLGYLKFHLLLGLSLAACQGYFFWEFWELYR